MVFIWQSVQLIDSYDIRGIFFVWWLDFRNWNELCACICHWTFWDFFCGKRYVLEESNCNSFNRQRYNFKQHRSKTFQVINLICFLVLKLYRYEVTILFYFFVIFLFYILLRRYLYCFSFLYVLLKMNTHENNLLNDIITPLVPWSLVSEKDEFGNIRILMAFKPYAVEIS